MKTMAVKKSKAELEIESVHRALVSHGSWYVGCGWYWGTDSRTSKILDILLVRGEVVTDTINLKRPAIHSKSCVWVPYTRTIYRPASEN